MQDMIDTKSLDSVVLCKSNAWVKLKNIEAVDGMKWNRPKKGKRGDAGLEAMIRCCPLLISG